MLSFSILGKSLHFPESRKAALEVVSSMQHHNLALKYWGYVSGYVIKRDYPFNVVMGRKKYDA